MSYKKVIQIFAVVGVLMLAGGSAWATTVTYQDNYINWPGWTPQYTDDLIGTPSVGDMTVTLSGGFLTKIELQVSGRQWFDTLFINTNWNGLYGDYQSWDIYVRTNSGTTPLLYSVGASYAYLLATDPGGGTNGRWGHPAGIGTGLTADPAGITVTETYLNDILTYNFTGLQVLDKFVIGYSVWCANDVFLTPVPEPFTMLLLGLGLVGVAGIGRRIRK
jgi:hypothetical protein